jgi:hypothetical protein
MERQIGRGTTKTRRARSLIRLRAYNELQQNVASLGADVPSGSLDVGGKLPGNALTVEVAVGPQRISTWLVLSSAYQPQSCKPYARAEISRISRAAFTDLPDRPDHSLLGHWAGIPPQAVLLARSRILVHRACAGLVGSGILPERRISSQFLPDQLWRRGESSKTTHDHSAQ